VIHYFFRHFEVLQDFLIKISCSEVESYFFYPIRI